LYDGPAMGRLHASHDRLEMQKLTTAQVRNQAIVETASAYLELAALRQALVRPRPARDSSQRVVELTAERLKEAPAVMADVVQARLKAARLAQGIAQLESREGVLEGQLLVLTGLPPGTAFQLGFESLPSLPDRSTDELAIVAAENSPDLKAALLERRA